MIIMNFVSIKLGISAEYLVLSLIPKLEGGGKPAAFDRDLQLHLTMNHRLVAKELITMAP